MKIVVGPGATPKDVLDAASIIGDSVRLPQWRRGLAGGDAEGEETHRFRVSTKAARKVLDRSEHESLLKKRCAPSRDLMND